jgi:hypothetical protein
VVLSFTGDLDLKPPFSEGAYNLTVLKGVTTRVELKQVQENSTESEDDRVDLGVGGP